MSRRAGKVASPKDDWQTPQWLLDALRAELGPIGLDPCTAPDNPTHAAAFCYSVGLDVDWEPLASGGWAFVNPPFSAAKAWSDKVLVEARCGLEIVLLLPASVNSRRFRVLTENCNALAFFGRRISYVDPATGREMRGADFDSACWYFGQRPLKFCGALMPYATCFATNHGLITTLKAQAAE